jgi:uncharacterized protein YbbK (DUF523 family)
MADFPKPKVLFSACLTGDKVRYDGGSAETPFTLKLAEFCEVLKVCPEVGVGLGVPRDRIIVHFEEGPPRVFCPSTGEDLTARILSFAEEFAGNLTEVDGVLLKSKSPSCGLSRTKTYRDREGRRFRGLGKGLFAVRLLELLPNLPAADELMLRDYRTRLHFLLRTFGSAHIREGDLERFHRIVSTSAYVISPRLEKAMRRERDRSRYRELFLRVFSRAPSLRALREMCGLLVPQELLDPPHRLP